MPPLLTGDLVRLRPVEPEDAETLWRWHNDPDVTRWLDFAYPEPLARIREKFTERPANGYARTVLMIETLDTGRAIGVTGLRDAEPETARAELDIYLGEKDTWGQGYGTDAVRAVCRLGFDAMRLHLIALWVVAENAPALRCYEKAGFRQDGRHREAFRDDEGRWHDMILMSLLEGELR